MSNAVPWDQAAVSFDIAEQHSKKGLIASAGAFVQHATALNSKPKLNKNKDKSVFISFFYILIIIKSPSLFKKY